MKVLALNPGSSSLKASLIESVGEETLATTAADWSPDANAADARASAVARAVSKLRESGGPPAAVGYRVVHGGTAFQEATPIDEGALAQIEALDELAPLHNRIAAETIRAAQRLLPEVPHVACFDTAFHATLGEEAWRYPVPDAWLTRYGVRRFGFHGLSVEWAVERAATLLDRPVSELQLVVAHLGSGSSVTAVAGGRSVDTSMGLTPLEGLMMGTRAGSLDPGILLHLLRAGVDPDELSDALEHRSGLLAVSGNGDVAELERRASNGDEAASLGLAMYARRAAAGIASAATTLVRLDGIVFTGGIGEHAELVRDAICERLGQLGLKRPPIGPSEGDAVITGHEGGVAVLRITAREDIVIARRTAQLVEDVRSIRP